MTTAQLEHLRLIDAHLERLLAIAEKRIPGAYFSDHFYDVWAKGNGYNYLAAQVDDGTTSSFIASCAGNAEAGWKATRAAIKVIVDCNPYSGTGSPSSVLLDSILSAFPLEMLKHNDN